MSLHCLQKERLQLQMARRLVMWSLLPVVLFDGGADSSVKRLVAIMCSFVDLKQRGHRG
jgi:hypothetical protein